MKSPFPGMDPFIEGCGLWEDFHGHLIEKIFETLAVTVPAKYVVRTMPVSAPSFRLSPIPTSMKGMPSDMSTSKILALADPLSTQTNAKVTPARSFTLEASINLR